MNIKRSTFYRSFLVRSGRVARGIFFSFCALGMAASASADANSVYHGYLRTPDGTITSFDAPCADTTPGSDDGTYPYSINDAGVITGSYQDSNNVYHGFIMLPDN